MKNKKVIIGILVIGIILIGGLWIWLNRNITVQLPYHSATVKNITLLNGHGDILISTSNQEEIDKIVTKLDYIFSHLKKVYYIDGICKTPKWILVISYDTQQFEITCWVSGVGPIISINNEHYTFEIPEEDELHFIFGDLYSKS